MSDELKRFRDLYGGKAGYVSVYADGLEVPWCPLSIGKYLDILRKTDFVPPEEVDDLIFSSSVTDPYLVETADFSKSGTVTTTASSILANSWANSEEEFDLVLNYYRHHISQAVAEECVLTILIAFPSYTPDDVYDMDFETLMHRLALAERKLLETGVLKEPLKFTKQEKPQEKSEPLNKHLRPQKPQQQKEEDKTVFDVMK